jgi:hypothetical protein
LRAVAPVTLILYLHKWLRYGDIRRPRNAGLVALFTVLGPREADRQPPSGRARDYSVGKSENPLVSASYPILPAPSNIAAWNSSSAAS